MFDFWRKPRRTESERLEQLRRRRAWWEHIPYGQLVQIKRQTLDVDHPVGTVGRVLSEEGHGIVRHPGWVSIKPKFPGIHGVHVLVRFGNAEPELCSLSDLAPA